MIRSKFFRTAVALVAISLAYNTIQTSFADEQGDKACSYVPALKAKWNSRPGDFLRKYRHGFYGLGFALSAKALGLAASREGEAVELLYQEMIKQAETEAAEMTKKAETEALELTRQAEVKALQEFERKSPLEMAQLAAEDLVREGFSVSNVDHLVGRTADHVVSSGWATSIGGSVVKVPKNEVALKTHLKEMFETRIKALGNLLNPGEVESAVEEAIHEVIPNLVAHHSKFIPSMGGDDAWFAADERAEEAARQFGNSSRVKEAFAKVISKLGFSDAGKKTLAEVAKSKVVKRSFVTTTAKSLLASSPWVKTFFERVGSGALKVLPRGIALDTLRKSIMTRAKNLAKAANPTRALETACRTYPRAAKVLGRVAVGVGLVMTVVGPIVDVAMMEDDISDESSMYVTHPENLLAMNDADICRFIDSNGATRQTVIALAEDVLGAQQFGGGHQLACEGGADQLSEDSLKSGCASSGSSVIGNHNRNGVLSVSIN